MSNQNTINELVEFVRTSIEFHPKLVALCVLAEKQQADLTKVLEERASWELDAKLQLDLAEADLARVTAERDHWIALYKERNKTAAILEDTSIALRARVAELESSCRDLRVAYEQNASQCVRLNRELALKSDTVEWLNGVTIQRQRAEQAERRNAELVAALDDLLECPTVTDRATCPNGDPSRIDEAPEWQAVLQISCAWTRYKKLKALARAESATPAKQEVKS